MNRRELVMPYCSHVIAREYFCAGRAAVCCCLPLSAGRDFKQSWGFGTAAAHIHSEFGALDGKTRKKCFPSGLMESDWLHLLQLITEN